MTLPEPSETDNSEKQIDSPTSSSTCSCLFSRCHPKSRLYTISALLVLSLLGWRLYADQDFWHHAWQQQTLFPQHGAAQFRVQQTEHSVQFPPSQRPSQRRHFPFDISTVTVPVDEILSGGPPKDGIPALTNPKFIAPNEATYLNPDDRVIGISSSNQAKAYPLKILNYHEIVNDRLGELPVAVTYCPLCDSCTVFNRNTELGEREFGVSGLLYNSNVLMYDRGGDIESLWSQVMAQGISGPAAKKSLTALPLELTTWRDWQARHPNTLVLSAETGHHRNYNHSPYGSYFSSPRLMFPAKPSNDRLPTKSRVLGVWTGSIAKAYPESSFSNDRLSIDDRLDGKKISLEFNPESNSIRVVEADQGVQWMYSLWFAWVAFHPDTQVHSQ